MGTARLEAFTDGVIAIIITIIVLEMKVPASADLGAIPLAFLSPRIAIALDVAIAGTWFVPDRRIETAV